MKYLLKPSQLQSLLELSSQGLIAPDTPFEDILPIYRPGGKKKVKAVPTGSPRLRQGDVVDTFRRGLTEPWVGMCSELYDEIEVTEGSTLAKTFLNPQALGWYLRGKIDHADSGYSKKRYNRGQVYTIQPLTEEGSSDGQHI